MLPQVSAIIPTYNSSAWIRESLGSVLKQTYANIEIIVVDDGSQDSTVEILGDFGGTIRVLQRGHTGIGAARNAGMEAATGEYLAFLDSDDLWQPEKIRLQMEFMAESPECCMLYTDAEEFCGSEVDAKSFFAKFPSLTSNGNIAKSMVLNWAVPLTSSVVVRRDFVQQNGIRFHPSASCAEDLSMFLEIVLHGGSICSLNDRLVRRRLHGSNASGDHYNRFFQRLTVYEDLLRRFPDMPSSVRKVVRAGLRDANFRVADRHWGELDLPPARKHFRSAMAFDSWGRHAALLWALTFAPKQALIRLKEFKSRWGAARGPAINSGACKSAQGQGRARD